MIRPGHAEPLQRPAGEQDARKRRRGARAHRRHGARLASTIERLPGRCGRRAAPDERRDRDGEDDDGDRQARRRRADAELAAELRQDRLRRVHRREHRGGADQEAREGLLRADRRRSSGQATQPGYRARIGMAARERGTRSRTPRSSRSSPRAAASCSTAASRPSSSACCPPRALPREDDLWGTWPLYRAPETVARRPSRVRRGGLRRDLDRHVVGPRRRTDGSGEAKSGLLHWMDIARTGIRLARTRRGRGHRPAARGRLLHLRRGGVARAAPARRACWRGSSRTSRRT